MDPASWDKAKAVLFEALERDAEDREAFVRRRCPDPDTCAKILSQLASARTRDDLAANHSGGPLLGAHDGILGEGDALDPGSKVGPYLIIDRIGSGGMGRVFLGTDPRLQRRVALKCLLDSRAAGADVRSRILHEARAAAREEIEQTLKKVPVRWREQARRWLVRVAVAVPAAILALGLIGFITSMQFNFVFGRDGEFARFGVEPWPKYIVWGLMAVTPVAFIMTVSAAGVMGAKFLLTLLELIGPVGHLGRRVRDRRHDLAVAAGLDRSGGLAQALTGLAIATLVGLLWYYADLVRALSSFFNSAPIEQLMPMTDSAPARWRYHIALSIATLAFGFGLYKVMKLRAREKPREGRINVAMLAAVVAVMVVMNEAPYRTFHQRDLQRVDLAGAHCYANGESGDEVLVLCPGREPPRNRVVRRNDTQLEWRKNKENVFKGVSPVVSR